MLISRGALGTLSYGAYLYSQVEKVSVTRAHRKEENVPNKSGMHGQAPPPASSVGKEGDTKLRWSLHNKAYLALWSDAAVTPPVSNHPMSYRLASQTQG